MKLSPLGVFVVLLGALAGIFIWVVGYIGLPNGSTHRQLAKNPPIQSSVASASSGSTSGSGQSGTSGNSSGTASNASGGQSGSASAPSQLVNLPKIPASQIHLVDTTAPGYQIFESTCSGCHGQSAEGGFGPPIYAIGKYWSQAQIQAFVTQGRGGMPPKGGLSSDSQVQQVVAWLSQQKG